ncbi:MAG: efflux RND transporter permease subunit [Ignavibacterium sp.]
MRLPKLAIENYQFTIIVFVLFIVLGIVSFITMPRSEDPVVSPPGSTIVVLYPGATPTDLEELVVDPIEEELNQLDNIKEIRSQMKDGLAVVEIEFEAGSDADEKYSDVIQKVNIAKGDLPDDILKIDVTKWEVTDVAILQAALVSETAKYKNLQFEGERLKELIENVAGVKEVKVIAYPEQEVRISIDLNKLSQTKIALSRIIQLIQSSNVNIPGGSVDIGEKKFNINTSGSYKDLDEIRNTVIDVSEDNIIYLKDLANVDFTYEDEKYFARFNDERTIFVTVTQKAGTNIYTVMDGIKEKVEMFKTDLPADISYKTVLDQTINVSNRLNGFLINLLQGLVLVGIIVFFAMGFRASIIVMLAIPISILIGLFLLDLSEYGLQQMTIAGLVIALGLLVDNAIVVTENISRYMNKGLKPFNAAVKGTSEIAWAVTSATATTLLAFVPLMMIGDVTGDFIRSMPTIVVFTLSASLLVSLTLTPFLSSRMIRANVEKQSKVVKLLQKLIDTRYKKRVVTALKYPKTVIAIAVAVLLGSLVLFPLIGVSFFPKADRPQFMVNVNLPEGTNIGKTNEVVSYVESVLEKENRVEKYASNIGKGNPRIYYNVIERNEQSNFGQIFITVPEFNEEELMKLASDLRSKFNDYPGARIEVKTFEQGPPVEAPIAIRLIGENLDELRAISLNVENIFKQTDGVININNPLKTTKLDLQIRINQDKAAIYGVPMHEIDKTVRLAIEGMTVSTFRDKNGEDHNIVVRLPIKNKASISDFDKIYISSVTGAQVSLSQLAAVEFTTSPLVINHYKLNRNVLITADVKEGENVTDLTRSIVDQLNEMHFPKGYSFSVGGEAETRQSSFGGMFKAVLLALLGILAVLVLQFRSFTQSLIVFSAIPLALIGSFLALFITGYTFSFTAFVGLTSLVGIVVNNSIILVDYSNQLIREGVSIKEAVVEAGSVRFVPIVLTTSTTIGGLLPLTLGGGTLWAPMGWTIIGGLLVSTILTLIVVPVLYKIFTKETKNSVNEK